MGYRRSTVLPFPLKVGGRRREPDARLPGGGVLLRLRDGRDWDASRNANWDAFLALAEQAWNWRDQDSLDVIEECVIRLRRSVAADWAERPRKANRKRD